MGRGYTDAINSPSFDAGGTLMNFGILDNLNMKHGLTDPSRVEFFHVGKKVELPKGKVDNLGVETF